MLKQVYVREGRRDSSVVRRRGAANAVGSRASFNFEFSMETCVGEAQISTETQNGYQSCRCRSSKKECGRQPCRSIFGRFCGRRELFLEVCLMLYVIDGHLIYIALSVLL